MEEIESDDETVEFDIEVVSSSSSGSFELQNDDNNNNLAIDFSCDGEPEGEHATAAQCADNQQHKDPPPPTRANAIDERLQTLDETKCESDKKCQEEIERSKIRHESTIAIEQVSAESDQPPPALGHDLVDELGNSERLIDSQQERKSEEEIRSDGPLDSEAIKATSVQQQCVEHETDDVGTEPYKDDSRQRERVDESTFGDFTQGLVDTGAEQCGTPEFSGEQTGPIVDVAALGTADLTVVRRSFTSGQENDLTNNQVESPCGLTYAEFEAQPAPALDHVEQSPEAIIRKDTIEVQPTSLAVDCRLISEPIECPTSWPPNNSCDYLYELADSKVPIEILPADQVAAPMGYSDDNHDGIKSEEAVTLNDEEEPECQANVDQVRDAVNEGDQSPPADAEESQHRMVDISVRLDEVPDVYSDQAHSPAVSPGLDSENSQHSNLSLAALSHTTNQSSGHDVLYQQQMHNLHQQQVRRSSSAHLFAGTLDDEDLEREFDEEPEFERRDVQVKRNRNPRDEYRLGDELGRGKFGTVVRCVEEASGRALAAKFIHMRRREDRDDVEREVAIMSVLQHKRLLQLYDAFDDGRGEMCLITELVEGGELFERIVDDDFDLTERKAAIFMRQICEGIDYMHGQQIVHLDMKPENILCLSRTGNRIKLIDFGLARRLDPEKPTRVMFGTPDFAAPEVLGYETVTLATDMWSIGVICYVLLSGLSPFMGDSDMETMANVMRATFDFNDSAFEAISDLAKDFISKLLVRNPNERLKPSECLKHAWLARGGAPLEAAIRSRRESSAVMISAHHRLALEQAAMLAAAVAAAAAATAAAGAPDVDNQHHTDSPQTPPVTPGTGPFLSRASFGAESSASSSGTYSLDKRRLKKYVVRRKWHKTVHAIMALGRMGANLRI